MKLRFKSIRTICAAIMMIAALVVSAAATDDTSIEDQMAANSAAWWIAYENGDQETMDALHAENEALAAELAGEGGEVNYNEGRTMLAGNQDNSQRSKPVALHGKAGTGRSVQSRFC